MSLPFHTGRARGREAGTASVQERRGVEFKDSKEEGLGLFRYTGVSEQGNPTLLLCVYSVRHFSFVLLGLAGQGVSV